MRLAIHQTAFVLCASLGTLAISGCATSSLLLWDRDAVVQATPANPVVNVVAIWDPGEGRGTDGKTTRGFVGKIMFFTAKDKTPVKVDGALQVFVYDDQGTQEEMVKPVAEYSYSPQDLAGIYQKADKLGATYVGFVPYPKRGTNKVNCSIRLRYVPVDPKTGQVIHEAGMFSEMAYITLPGPDRKAEEQALAEAQTRKLEAEALANRQGELLGKIQAPEVKRPAAEPLTEAERERIIAEARAAQARDMDEDEAPVEPLEPSEDIPAVLPRKSLVSTAGATEPVEAAPPARKLRHPLADFTDTEPFPEAEPAPAPDPVCTPAVSETKVEPPATDEIAPQEAPASLVPPKPITHSTAGTTAEIQTASAEAPEPTLAEHPTFATTPARAPQPQRLAEPPAKAELVAATPGAPADSSPRGLAGWIFGYGLQGLALLICLSYACKYLPQTTSLGARLSAAVRAFRGEG